VNKVFLSGLLFYFCLVGAAVAESKIDCLLFVIEDSWQNRDGGSGAIVDTAIVELLSIVPEETLIWLNSKEKIKKGLLAKWQYTVFTDYVGNKMEDLEQFKNSLINSLKQCSCKDKEIEELKKNFLEVLDGTIIREIK
jgi:hypothetical protein